MKKPKTFFSGLKAGMMEFGENISAIINSILLSIIYILGIGMPSIVAKIVGKKFMPLSPEKGAKTYWSDMNVGDTKDKDKYYRQF